MDLKNELIFLDCKIFLRGDTLDFIKYRKMGPLTVISNFKHSLMPPKYLKGGIMTTLHREKTACSTHELFLGSLKEMNEVFYKNAYLSGLVDSKIKTFLNDNKKPERPPNNLTICFNYNSPNIEQYVYKLTNKMAKFVPGFRVNVSFRTMKVNQLISRQAKALTETFEAANTVYRFDCPCKDFYIGQSGRTLIIRCGEHLSENSNIGVHIETCPIFTEKQSDFLADNRKNFKTLTIAKTNFLLQYFSIIKRGFRTKWDRLKYEAFLIRLHSPPT